jgi:hypothetical protein
MLIPWAILPMARAVDPPPDGGYSGANTAEGDGALFTGGGFHNTAIGFQALYSNSGGYENTATGSYALYSNIEGYSNTATGSGALFSNGDGGYNTATGIQALYSNSSGFFNTATGYGALAFNTLGQGNTATGDVALLYNATGSANTADGEFALVYNTSGSYNTASGQASLFSNTTGHNNTADGHNALDENTTGSNNIAVGANAGGNLTTGNNNIDIGANVRGIAGEASTIRIGKQGTQKNTFVAGIAGVAVSGNQVVVDSNGKLGVATSSARFKEAIKPMDNASEAILALKPASFRYKEEVDPERIPQFGLIAEEVEKVNPDLVGHDENGNINAVRYEAVNAMLLNEFLKEHRKVQEQGATIAQMKKQIEVLTVGLQKVTAQVESGKSSVRVAISNE